MREALKKIKVQFICLSENIFSILMLYAVFVGVVVFLMFLAALLLGNEWIAVQAGQLMQTAIPVSACATAIALVGFYVSNKHALTIDSSEETETNE